MQYLSSRLNGQLYRCIKQFSDFAGQFIGREAEGRGESFEANKVLWLSCDNQQQSAYFRLAEEHYERYATAIKVKKHIYYLLLMFL